MGETITLNGIKYILGTLGLFSFYSTDHSKIISTQLGGMLCTNDKNFSLKIEKLNENVPQMPLWMEKRIILNAVFEYIYLNPYCYWYGELIISFMQRLKILFHLSDELIIKFEDVSSYPLRMGSQLACIGISQLSTIDSNLQQRRQIVSKLHAIEPLKDFSAAHLPLLRYSFLVKDRNAFLRQLGAKFQLGVWFTTIFQGRDDHFEELGYRHGSCPRAEFIAQHIVNFPTHQAMDFEQIEASLSKISYEVI
jgi:dTDP-4-amino-4,6-dideoxygalactose transaminase